METFTCRVKRIVFTNPESGFSILSVIREGNRFGYETVKCTGLFNPTVDMRLQVVGETVKDPKHGEQFVASAFEEILPVSKKDVVDYLSNGPFKGIGPKVAERIWDMFGEDTFDAISRKDERLLSVSGISPRVMENLMDKWNETVGMRNISVALARWGLTPLAIAKIYRTYGAKSVESLKKNPYRLAYEVDGFGFKKADEIALASGVDPDGFERAECCAAYLLDEAAEKGGDTYLYRTALAARMRETLGTTDDALISAHLKAFEHSKQIEVEGDRFFIPAVRRAEESVAEQLGELLDIPGKPLRYDLGSLEREAGFEYDPIQRAAIMKASESKVMVLTGGPGTGKTTITKAIASVYAGSHLKILACAPTGKAAKRMTEVTGLKAQTIHRMLKWDPAEGRFTYGRSKPLPCDAVVVDETSMVNIRLMKSLLEAIPPHARVLFVGDKDQLPCIGAGDPLRDMIASGEVPTVTLEHVFRQGEGSSIAKGAKAVKEGRLPEFDRTREGSLYFVPVEDQEEILSKVRGYVSENLPRRYLVPPSEIEVLTPRKKKTTVCSDTLNSILQQTLNPPTEKTQEIKVGERLFRTGDRIMQTKNNYDLQLFNGDEGTVEKVNPQERVMLAKFDGRSVILDRVALEDITLSYAATVHKSQGSEYPVVVVPVTTSHSIMLFRNLIYTAMTRAKTACIIVGQKEALRKAVANNNPSRRNTTLAERIISERKIRREKKLERKAKDVRGKRGIGFDGMFRL